MGRDAFSRAWRFLDYKAAAKRSAVVFAVVTAILYVGFLIVLGLFADLMVNRGKIPSFTDLPLAAQDAFVDHWAAEEETARRDRLISAGLEEKRAGEVAVSGEPSDLSLAEKDRLWRAHVREILDDHVGAEAADLIGEDPSDQDLADRGILSLVVSSEGQFYHRAVGGLARWLPWTWQSNHPSRPNYFYYLAGLLTAAVALALVRTVVMFLMNYNAALATIEASNRLRRAVYHHTFRLGTLAFRALGPSEAVGIFTRQIEAVHEGLHAWLTVVYREPVKFGLLLIFALAVNFWLALAFLIFALLVWLVGGQIAVYFRRQERSATRLAAEQLALLQESLMMMRLVKCYLMELFNQSRVERQLSRHSRAQFRRYRGQAIYRPVLVFLGTLAALVLLFVGGLIVLSGRLGVASAIALATALVSLYWPLVNFLEHRRVLRRAREAAIILFKFLDRPGEVGQVVGAEFLPPLNRQLEFLNVTLKEPGTGRALLQGVSFTIPAGRHVALVGPDDMQKHALVYLLPRFLDPTSGEIRIDQHNLRWVTFDSLRAQIAMVMQHNLVFNDTVANNIGCGDPGFDLPKVIAAAKVAHAHHFIQKLPQGYETAIGEMGHYLNASEQFRIALARAILRDPALFIIEEPINPLDENSRDLLDDTFARALAGRTVIFLPHRISTIRNCDRVLLLHKGKVEAAGEHRELLSQNQLYRHLQYLEFNEFAEMV